MTVENNDDFGFDFEYETENDGGEQQQQQQRTPTPEENEAYQKALKEAQEARAQAQALQQQVQGLAEWKNKAMRMFDPDSAAPEDEKKRFHEQLVHDPLKLKQDLKQETLQEILQYQQQQEQQQRYLQALNMEFQQNYGDLKGYESYVDKDIFTVMQEAIQKGEDLTPQEVVKRGVDRFRNSFGHLMKQANQVTQNQQMQRQAMHLDIGGRSGNNQPPQGSPILGGKRPEDLWKMSNNDWEKYRNAQLRKAYEV